MGEQDFFQHPSDQSISGIHQWRAWQKELEGKESLVVAILHQETSKKARHLDISGYRLPLVTPSIAPRFWTIQLSKQNLFRKQQGPEAARGNISFTSFFVRCNNLPVKKRHQVGMCLPIIPNWSYLLQIWQCTKVWHCTNGRAGIIPTSYLCELDIVQNTSGRTGMEGKAGNPNWLCKI